VPALFLENKYLNTDQIPRWLSRWLFW